MIDDVTKDVIAVVSWDDMQARLGPSIDFSNSTVRNSFLQSIEDNLLIMDSGGVNNGAGTEIEVSEEDLAKLGNARFLVIGADKGRVETGSLSADYKFGTVHNDIIMGYKPAFMGDGGGQGFKAGNDNLWGFEGDDLFVGGGGLNNIYGGEGEDTAAYFEATSGLTVDLSDTYKDEQGLEYAVARAGY